MHESSRSLEDTDRRQINSVFFVTFHFPPEVGGIQTRISHYIDDFMTKGFIVTVLVLTSRKRSLTNESSGRLETIVRPGDLGNLVPNVKKMLESLVERHPDVIHVFTGASTLLGTVALVLARISGRKAVISVFGREDFVFSSLLGRILFSTSTALATSITSNSLYTRSLFSKKLQAKVYVLSGIAVPPSSSVMSLEEDNTTILFVGRLVRRKGIDDLIRAFALVRARYVPDAKLVIVGDGPERESLKDLASSLGLLSSVKFTGTLRGQSLQEAYARCSICVLPSKKIEGDTATEGLGLSLVEASFHSKPIVGTLHGGIPELIVPGVNGFLVPEADAEKLAEVLGKMLLDPGMLERLGSNSRDIAVKKYSLGAASDRLLEAYLQSRVSSDSPCTHQLVESKSKALLTC